MTTGYRIDVDGPGAAEFGFTGDRFEPWSYLWRWPDRVCISLVGTRHEGRGDFAQLVQTILGLGLAVEVPTPMDRMRSILERNGFTPRRVYDALFLDEVEVWRREPGRIS